MDRELAEQHLRNKSFFNPNWTDEQVASALNTANNEAIKRGVTSGTYTFEYLGKNVTIYLDNGVFRTGYGDYKYTYDELLALFVEEK